MASMPSSEKSVSEDSAAAPKKAAPAKKKHAVAFDSSFEVAPGVETVSVTVGGSKIVELPTSGDPVEVSAKDAKLLVQSPAVKVAN